MTKLRLGILASHGGTNLQSIIDSCEAARIPAEVVVVISNNGQSGALERARKHRIDAVHLSNKHYPDNEDLDEAIVKVLREHEVDLVCLAGYMKKRGPKFLSAFKNRILNIHPALLPKFGGKGFYGMRVHEAVLAAEEKESGVTVHIVDEKYDHGSILAQKRVPVLPDDAPETLAARILVEEHKIYSEVIGKIATGDIKLPD
ncbi:phosphoribosylglycinamide formyltransferase [candidate division TA06 bacterium]|uniref:Phosphoribosylglycinamide formyltransferase n=1 Tax=candidate division TA06 bacterium TaxID=2250710 RepID=A0A523URY9_UNCT6|nr:MAG: phosphoribosylglycinamide formyltransferase [candidate division TA06 bacterium]